jgi:hypothetical protein
MPPELKRVIRLTSFAEEARTRPALRYWLSRPLDPDEDPASEWHGAHDRRRKPMSD